MCRACRSSRGVDIDAHIAMDYLLVGVNWRAAAEAMSKRIKGLEAKSGVEHLRGEFTLSPFSKPNYVILDLLVSSPSTRR